jgi:hypothetical protein
MMTTHLLKKRVQSEWNKATVKFAASGIGKCYRPVTDKARY